MYLSLSACSLDGTLGLGDAPAVGESSVLDEFSRCEVEPDYDYDSGARRYLVYSQEDAEALRGCKRLAWPLVIGGSVDDLLPLRDLEQVSSLTIHGAGRLQDLRGLEGLTRAYSVSISSNESLRSLAGLGSDLKVETRLYVGRNDALYDIEALGDVGVAAAGQHAFRLELYDNDSLLSLAPLADFVGGEPNLEVRIAASTPTDISFIAAQPRYDALTLSGPQLYGYSALRQVEQIGTLSLRASYLNDLSFLDNLTRLRHLELENLEHLNSLVGLSPSIALDSLRLRNLPALTDVGGLGATITRSLSLSDLPFLQAGKLLEVHVPLDTDTLPSLFVEDCPALRSLPKIHGATRLQALDLRLLPLVDLEQLDFVEDVSAELIIWENDQLLQSSADKFAQRMSAEFQRVGRNLRWLEPASCSWPEDGYCDGGEFCWNDEVDCWVDVGGC